MTECHTAAVVASYLEAVDSEDDEESEGYSYSQDDELSDSTGEPGSGHVDHSATEEFNSGTVTPVSSEKFSLVAKKNTKSQVWRHFGLKQVDGRTMEADKPVCRECSV